MSSRTRVAGFTLVAMTALFGAFAVWAISTEADLGLFGWFIYLVALDAAHDRVKEILGREDSDDEDDESPRRARTKTTFNTEK